MLFAASLTYDRKGLRTIYGDSKGWQSAGVARGGSGSAKCGVTMSGTTATADVTGLVGLIEVEQGSKSTRSGKNVGRGWCAQSAGNRWKNPGKAQVSTFFELAHARGVRRLSRVKEYATAIFWVDSHEMRGLCSLYAASYRIILPVVAVNRDKRR